MKKIILSMFLIGILFLVGCEEYVAKECQTCEEPQIAKGKAILDVEMYQTAFNELDTTEMFFDYWIYNYGDTEAKNIKVECILLDENYNVLTKVIDNYGNLASNSIKFGEVTFKKPSSITMNDPLTGSCYVESCSNCDILYKRIPKIVEEYEGLK